MAPDLLLRRLREIEKTMGKQVPFRGGPRKIDIDLLLYGKWTGEKRDLAVPHPRLHRRKFVLVPLTEIAPAFVHPGLGKTSSRLLRECRSNEEVDLWGPW